ncbi:hypothetical protein H8S58_16505 [Bacteroides sp. NSJ-2]|nr:hypothetical protein [Bacteroides hominis (ex Liu et al. 2022)]MBC5614543.1 hypothetical protein [Bacteroides hominis (ex Liu et al. 2022)]
MLQVSFSFIGVFVLVLVLATICKRHQRVILWTAAICIFVGTMFLVGLGIVDPVGGDGPNMPALLSIVIALSGTATLAIGAEKVHAKRREKDNGTQISDHRREQPLEEEGTPQEVKSGIVLPERLDTELARRIFAKALERGYIKEINSHYKWNGSKALLAYMCGRIYCGDTSVYDRTDQKPYWKFGKSDFFPDSELNVLFDISDIGQSRQNRKDMKVPTKSQEIDKLFE